LRDYDDKGSDAIRCVSCGRGMTRRRGNLFCSECCRAGQHHIIRSDKCDKSKSPPRFLNGGWACRRGASHRCHCRRAAAFAAADKILRDRRILVHSIYENIHRKSSHDRSENPEREDDDLQRSRDESGQSQSCASRRRRDALELRSIGPVPSRHRERRHHARVQSEPRCAAPPPEVNNLPCRCHADFFVLHGSFEAPYF
jgi:hypothetical protein